MPRKAKKTRRLGQKQCPKCEKWIRGPRTRVCPRCSHEFQPKPVKAPAAPEPVAAAAVTTEKPVRNGDGITIEQIKAVGEMVRIVGGFSRFREMLDTIRAVGGLKRLQGLLDAMAVTE